MLRVTDNCLSQRYATCGHFKMCHISSVSYFKCVIFKCQACDEACDFVLHHSEREGAFYDEYTCTYCCILYIGPISSTYYLYLTLSLPTTKPLFTAFAFKLQWWWCHRRCHAEHPIRHRPLGPVPS